MSEPTEQEILQAIENAVNVLAPSFAFGIYDVDDIKQEARVEGWKAAKRYDGKRPLDNFIYICIRNGLTNLKRNKLRRSYSESPCKACHEGTPHLATEDCEKHSQWAKRNDTKANLMCPFGLHEGVGQDGQSEFNAELKEMLDLIDEKLDVNLRSVYLMMRAGESVPRAKRLAVEKAIREILNIEEGG